MGFQDHAKIASSLFASPQCGTDPFDGVLGPSGSRYLETEAFGNPVDDGFVQGNTATIDGRDQLTGALDIRQRAGNWLEAPEKATQNGMHGSGQHTGFARIINLAPDRYHPPNRIFGQSDNGLDGRASFPVTPFQS